MVFIPGYRGQQGARHGEAVHVLRSAGPSPLAAVAQGAHGMRGTQAASAPLPPGEKEGRRWTVTTSLARNIIPDWYSHGGIIRDREPNREYFVARGNKARRFILEPVG